MLCPLGPWGRSSPFQKHEGGAPAPKALGGPTPECLEGKGGHISEREKAELMAGLGNLFRSTKQAVTELPEKGMGLRETEVPVHRKGSR